MAYFKPILKYNVRCIFSSVGGGKTKETNREGEREREGKAQGGLKQAENHIGGDTLMNLEF